MLIITTANVQLKVQFAEILSAEGLLTAIFAEFLGRRNFKLYGS